MNNLIGTEDLDAFAEVRLVDTGLLKPRFMRILVIKLDHMGDFIIAIPSIMKLRARYPYAQIDALVGSWNQEVAQLLGVFENIYVLDFFKKQSSVSPSILERSLDGLLEHMNEYDYAIDLRRQPDTRFILIKLPSRVYVGYTTNDRSIDIHLGVSIPGVMDVPFKMTELNNKPIALQMLSLIDALPADVNDFIRLPSFVKNQFEKLGSVAIFPKAGNDVKEWGEQNFEMLIHHLAINPDVSAISIYFSNYEEAVKYKRKTDAKIKILYGLTYSELIESLSSHSVCVANNSFGAHIASYLGVKVIGVYSGHETVAEWAPIIGDSKIAYISVECSPCHIPHKSDCKQNFKCMVNITPDYIYKAVISELKKSLLVSRNNENLNAELLKVTDYKSVELNNTEIMVEASQITPSIQMQNGFVSNQSISHLLIDIDPARFRRTYGIYEDFLLCIDPVDNCVDLFMFFVRHRCCHHGPTKLVVMGVFNDVKPAHPDIIYLGYASKENKWDALAASVAQIIPSVCENYTLLSLGAWFVGKPIVVNIQCDELVDQCRKANGGLWYSDYEEFSTCLLYLQKGCNSGILGRQGWGFVNGHYSWSDRHSAPHKNF